MNTQANQFYKEPWFGILVTIIFFPVGIYIMYRFGPWHKRTKLTLAIVLSIICIAVWTIAGFAPASSNPGIGETWLSTKSPAATVTVKSTMNFQVDNQGQVRLQGHVNVPTGAKLHVTVTHDDTVVGDTVSVKRNHFTTAPLAVDKHALSPDKYKVHLVNGAWAQQPKKVTTKLGTDGQLLRGAETKKTNAGRSIDFYTTVNYKP